MEWDLGQNSEVDHILWQSDNSFRELCRTTSEMEESSQNFESFIVRLSSSLE